MRMLAIVVLLFGVACGLRKRRHASLQQKNHARGVEGTGVGSLWTFGCPHVSAPALRNPQRSDGCFPGYRVVNIDYDPMFTDMDIITMLLNPTSYRHVRQATVKLIADTWLGLIEHDPLVYECGWEEDGYFQPSPLEHPKSFYQSRAMKVNDSTVPNLATVASLTLLNSYNYNIEEVASDVRSKGWGLVDSAVVGSGGIILGTETSHLMQDPTSLSCLLTFEGSDDAADWINNANVFQTPFCGLAQQVHSGFRDVVLEMVGDNEFQTKIRPQLQFCNKVDVMGHSLGGAAASLFAACASNPVQLGNDGYEEYQLFGWTPSTPKRLDYK